jgi:hypothetical protein
MLMIMILLAVGLDSDYVLDQPFKTQNQLHSDQLSLSKSSPRRHTNIRLRAAALQIVTELRRRRRRLFAQGGETIQ